MAARAGKRGGGGIYIISILQMTDAGTPWKCRNCGEVLGYVHRNSSRIHELYVGNVILSGAGSVTCGCKVVRRWEPDAILLERLVDKALENRKKCAILDKTTHLDDVDRE